ncbi:hypothetical protein AVEN_240465-1 [Araneus ventricosus]|uniref:Uncharacterized protein n=1 Tax=Araneus ventricosus TaxID=182803 RepID=A0A4Y2KSE9_ARAVE|nr:hypothetical protein AVEN_240465-1 [Araneus ventricosus]
MLSSDGLFLSTIVSKEHPHSQRIYEISLPHRFQPQNDRNDRGVTKRTLTSAWKNLCSESVVEYDIEESETVPCGAYNQRVFVFGEDQETGGG